jgi:hypothetical protein
MCISQGVELLLIWLEKHDSFRLNQDYNSLEWVLLEEDNFNKEERKACIVLALDELVSENVIKGAQSDDDNDEGTWVLMNSQKNASRQVQLSRQTCDNVALAVNSFLPMLDLNVPQKSDPKNLGEADVVILLSVIHSFAKRLDELETGGSGKGNGRKKK